MKIKNAAAHRVSNETASGYWPDGRCPLPGCGLDLDGDLSERYWILFKLEGSNSTFVWVDYCCPGHRHRHLEAFRQGNYRLLINEIPALKEIADREMTAGSE